MNTPLADLCGEHRHKAVPSETDSLVADVDAPLKENIFDLPQLQRIANVYHDREADHVERTVEAAEQVSYPRRLGINAQRLKLD